jgi:hypothetical protein
MTKFKYIKIYGERNTGTNYLSELIQANIKMNELKGGIKHSFFFKKNETRRDLYFKLFFHYNLGWKHSKINMAQIIKTTRFKNTLFITLTKNPYSFLLSLHKRPYHQSNKVISFSDFIRSEWKLTDRDNLGLNFINNPVELWNIKNLSYLDLLSKFESQVICLSYETLIENPILILDLIDTKLERTRQNEYVNIINSTKNDNKDYNSYRGYYLQEKWQSEISVEDYLYINSKLNKSVINYYGYKLIEH